MTKPKSKMKKEWMIHFGPWDSRELAEYTRRWMARTWDKKYIIIHPIPSPKSTKKKGKKASELFY